VRRRRSSRPASGWASAAMCGAASKRATAAAMAASWSAALARADRAASLAFLLASSACARRPARAVRQAPSAHAGGRERASRPQPAQVRGMHACACRSGLIHGKLEHAGAARGAHAATLIVCCIQQRGRLPRRPHHSAHQRLPARLVSGGGAGRAHLWHVPPDGAQHLLHVPRREGGSVLAFVLVPMSKHKALRQARRRAQRAGAHERRGHGARRAGQARGAAQRVLDLCLACGQVRRAVNVMCTSLQCDGRACRQSSQRPSGSRLTPVEARLPEKVLASRRCEHAPHALLIDTTRRSRATKHAIASEAPCEHSGRRAHGSASTRSASTTKGARPGHASTGALQSSEHATSCPATPCARAKPVRADSRHPRPGSAAPPGVAQRGAACAPASLQGCPTSGFCGRARGPARACARAAGAARAAGSPPRTAAAPPAGHARPPAASHWASASAEQCPRACPAARHTAGRRQALHADDVPEHVSCRLWMSQRPRRCGHQCGSPMSLCAGRRRARAPRAAWPASRSAPWPPAEQAGRGPPPSGQSPRGTPPARWRLRRWSSGPCAAPCSMCGWARSCEGAALCEQGSCTGDARAWHSHAPATRRSGTSGSSGARRTAASTAARASGSRPWHHPEEVLLGQLRTRQAALHTAARACPREHMHTHKQLTRRTALCLVMNRPRLLRSLACALAAMPTAEDMRLVRACAAARALAGFAPGHPPARACSSAQSCRACRAAGARRSCPMIRWCARPPRARPAPSGRSDARDCRQGPGCSHGCQALGQLRRGNCCWA